MGTKTTNLVRLRILTKLTNLSERRISDFVKTFIAMLCGCVGDMERRDAPTTATRLNRRKTFVSSKLAGVVPKAMMTRAKLTDLSNITSISVYDQL